MPTPWGPACPGCLPGGACFLPGLPRVTSSRQPSHSAEARGPLQGSANLSASPASEMGGPIPDQHGAVAQTQCHTEDLNTSKALVLLLCSFAPKWLGQPRLETAPELGKDGYPDTPDLPARGDLQVRDHWSWLSWLGPGGVSSVSVENGVPELEARTALRV